MANVKKIVGYRIGDFRPEGGWDIHLMNLLWSCAAGGGGGLAGDLV